MLHLARLTASNLFSLQEQIVCSGVRHPRDPVVPHALQLQPRDRRAPVGLGMPLPGHNCHHLGMMLGESLRPAIENTIFWWP